MTARRRRDRAAGPTALPPGTPPRYRCAGGTGGGPVPPIRRAAGRARRVRPAGGAGQHADAPQPAVAAAVPLGEAALRPASSALGPSSRASPSPRRRLSWLGFRSPGRSPPRAGRPAPATTSQPNGRRIRATRAVSNRLGPLPAPAAAGQGHGPRTRNPDQPVQVVGAAAGHRQAPGAGREEQRLGHRGHADARRRRVLAAADPAAGGTPPPRRRSAPGRHPRPGR